MISIKVLGIGAAGNKAAAQLIKSGVLEESSVRLINSTLGDVPDEFQQIAIALSSVDAGCGKERSMAKNLAIQALKTNLGRELAELITDEDRLVVITTSTGGGTGAGSSLIIGQYIQEVLGKKVMIYAFTGFEEDARELKNTVEFFKEINPSFIVQATSNKKFLDEAPNKLKAEELANNEFCNRMNIITGQGIVNSTQNIDETDLFKIITTPGYMDAGFISMSKLKNTEQFNSNIVNFLDERHSLETSKSAKRLAVVVNLQDKYQDFVDYKFTPLKDRYGVPFEVFNHVQDVQENLSDCIWFISSGMAMPLDEVQEIYDKYIEETNKINKAQDNFFDVANQMVSEDIDDMFDINTTANKASTTKTAESFFENL
ncbi:MAG: hypothetical protein ACLR5O_00145 [Romboutsia timonensis]|jgi:cell division GTPase FtsZ|uniref:hypothetical protein n=1 Tax=Romboutsia timonensis TaxID=1776391 RepID=UPI0039A0A2C1